MQQFVQEFLKSIYDKFLRDISKLPSLCELKALRFDDPNTQPNYANVAIQRLYLLRYAYAYFSEYYYMYNQMFDMNRNKSINILSIGAGCAIDYYAAYYANISNKVRLKYCGVDIINWKDRQDIGNYQFIIKDVGEIDLTQFFDVNLIIFPKSLFELPPGVVKNFFYAITLQPFRCKTILLISSQRPYFLAQDSNRFNQLVQCFNQIGFRKEIGGFFSAPKGCTSFFHIVKFSCPDFIRPLLEALADNCKNVEICPNGNGRGCCDSREQLNRGPMFSPKLSKIEYALVKRG